MTRLSRSSRKRFPLWARIFLVILALSFVVSAIGPAAVYLLVPVFYGILMLFPGKDRTNPVFFRVLPYLWGLSWIESAALLALLYTKGLGFLPLEAKPPSALELWFTFLATPPVLWLFLKRHRTCLAAILLAGAAALMIALHEYRNSDRTPLDGIELFSAFLEWGMLGAYSAIQLRPTKKKPV